MPKGGLDRSTQKVGGEPSFTRGTASSIMSDMYRAHHGDPAARERLNTHMRQMMDTDTWANVHEDQRAAITQTLGEGGELIAPVYLQEQWVAVPRAGSPIADSLHEMPWIHTNTINYPKIKTGTTVAVQTDTNSVSDTALRPNSSRAPRRPSLASRRFHRRLWTLRCRVWTRLSSMTSAAPM